ncbi:hypothetical protein HDV00_001035 [Rhizophlyctis rosea]|nr:hypothetical protein HDV00_001035 [Rhizophlyctis rosea]
MSDAIGAIIDHVHPEMGKAAETARNTRFENTLKAYRAYFQEEAPTDVWFVGEDEDPSDDEEASNHGLASPRFCSPIDDEIAARNYLLASTPHPDILYNTKVRVKQANKWKVLAVGNFPPSTSVLEVENKIIELHGAGVIRDLQGGS